MTYISTCFSHFGAIRCKRLCDARGFPARLMPVPRDLSSSCGTCVRWEGAGAPPEEFITEDIEQIVKVTPDGYAPVYRAPGL